MELVKYPILAYVLSTQTSSVNMIYV